MEGQRENALKMKLQAAAQSAPPELLNQLSDASRQAAELSAKLDTIFGVPAGSSPATDAAAGAAAGAAPIATTANGDAPPAAAPADAGRAPVLASALGPGEKAPNLPEVTDGPGPALAVASPQVQTAVAAPTTTVNNGFEPRVAAAEEAPGEVAEA